MGAPGNNRPALRQYFNFLEAEAMKEIKNGVWPVMITPFTPDNKIDRKSVV